MFGHKAKAPQEADNGGFRSFLKDFLEGVMQGLELFQELLRQQAENGPAAFGPIRPCPFEEPPEYQPFVIDGDLVLSTAGG